MDEFKSFVLIVGNHANADTKYGCQYRGSCYCQPYIFAKDNYDEYYSYKKYEFDMAVEVGIIVLNCNIVVNNIKCPEVVRNLTIHTSMVCYKGRQ